MTLEIIKKEKVDCDICGETALNDYFTIKTYVKGDIHCCIGCLNTIIIRADEEEKLDMNIFRIP